MLDQADAVAVMLKMVGNSGYETIYQESLPRIKLVFVPANYAHPWEQYKQQRILDKDLQTLRLFSATLSKDFPEKLATVDERDAVMKSVNDLYDRIAASEIDGDLKTIILDRLQQIKDALHEYNVRGIKGVRDAVANGVLAVVFNSRLQQSKDKAIMDFVNFLGSLGTIVTSVYLLCARFSARNDSITRCSQEMSIASLRQTIRTFNKLSDSIQITPDCIVEGPPRYQSVASLRGTRRHVIVDTPQNQDGEE